MNSDKIDNAIKFTKLGLSVAIIFGVIGTGALHIYDRYDRLNDRAETLRINEALLNKDLRQFDRERLEIVAERKNLSREKEELKEQKIIFREERERYKETIERQFIDKYENLEQSLRFDLDLRKKKLELAENSYAERSSVLKEKEDRCIDDQAVLIQREEDVMKLVEHYQSFNIVSDTKDGVCRTNRYPDLINAKRILEKIELKTKATPLEAKFSNFIKNERMKLSWVNIDLDCN